MTREMQKMLADLLTQYATDRRGTRRMVAAAKRDLETNLNEIAEERVRGAEPHRRPHLRYVKRRSRLKLEVIDRFYAIIKRAVP